jgi:hypothetical protein
MEIGDTLKKMVGMIEGGKDNVVAVGKAIKTDLNLLGSSEWMSHAYVDQELNKPHMNEWAGGYNRKSRNAGSFYGGYDATMRWPDKAEELKTLAKGYQMLDAVKSIGRKGGDLSNEMEDALANISGIEAAQRDIKEGKTYVMNDLFNEEIANKAKEYSTRYTKD